MAAFPPAILWWYAVHPFAGFWRRLGPVRSLWILGAVGVAIMAALATQHAWLMRGDLGFSWVTTVAGLALYSASMVVEVRCRRHLTKRILAGVPEMSADDPGTLLQEGLYARIRHPRYVAVALGLTGLSLVVNHRSVYVALAVMLVALYGVALLEERELRERFGEAYVDYMRRVPRFVPRVGG